MKIDSTLAAFSWWAALMFDLKTNRENTRRPMQGMYRKNRAGIIALGCIPALNG